MFALLEKKGIYRVQFVGNAMGIIFINYNLLQSINKPNSKNSLDIVKTYLLSVHQSILQTLNVEMPSDKIDDTIKIGMIIGTKTIPIEIVYLSFSVDQNKKLLDKALEFSDITKELQTATTQIIKNQSGFSADSFIISNSDPVEQNFLITRFNLEVIFGSYIQQSVDIFRPQPLHRTLQPINVEKAKERNISAMTLEHSYKELLEHRPELYKKLENFLNEEHEIFIPALSSIYEQMVIDIIAQLINHPPVKVHPSDIRLIRLYLKPNNLPLDFHDHILIINRKEIMRIFKLSPDEFKRMFIGDKNRIPPILKLNGKPFSIRNKHGEIRLSHILEVITFKTDKLNYYEIKPQWIFYQNGKQFIKDNFWKLRKIKDELNPKAHKPVINLRNKLITLHRPLEFTFKTLAGYAGLSRRKKREKSTIKSQILEYLTFLQNELGDINYEVINDEKVRIWRDSK